jgi:hypothetical protein
VTATLVPSVVRESMVTWVGRPRCRRREGGVAVGLLGELVEHARLGMTQMPGASCGALG